MPKSDWDRIVELFESRSKCVHQNRPHVSYEPGCLTIDTHGKCLCQMNDGDSRTLSDGLAIWLSRFGA